MPVTPERWRQVREIFDCAIERDSKERTTFPRDACLGDDDLHAEVLSLIASFDGSEEDFLEQPAAHRGEGGMGTVYAATRGDRVYLHLEANGEAGGYWAFATSTANT